MNGEGRAVNGGRAVGNTQRRISMYLVEELATELSRSKIKRAERLRLSRQVLALRRARRMERKAERRMIEAGRRAAELRATLESADY